VRLREDYARLVHGGGCFMRVCPMLVAAGGGEVARECGDDVSRGRTTVGDLFRGLRRYRRRRRV
jgi:hypothetical protein